MNCGSSRRGQVRHGFQEGISICVAICLVHWSVAGSRKGPVSALPSTWCMHRLLDFPPTNTYTLDTSPFQNLAAAAS